MMRKEGVCLHESLWVERHVSSPINYQKKMSGTLRREGVLQLWKVFLCASMEQKECTLRVHMEVHLWDDHRCGMVIWMSQEPKQQAKWLWGWSTCRSTTTNMHQWMRTLVTESMEFGQCSRWESNLCLKEWSCRNLANSGAVRLPH